jgi:hypothetical protein
MIEEIKATFGINQVPFDLMRRLSKIPKAQAPAYLEKIAREQRETRSIRRNQNLEVRTQHKILNR